MMEDAARTFYELDSEAAPDPDAETGRARLDTVDDQALTEDDQRRLASLRYGLIGRLHGISTP